MDVFEAHKYLDPTTFDQSPFLSFSSFADLTSDCLTLSSLSSPSPVKHQHQHHTPTPPASHSSGSPSPSSPFASVFLTTPSTPAVARYTDFGSHPPAASSSSHAHHVKQRSSSSTSDWNSPVTPSLTYKSSVESFSQDPDFLLPPSSTHSASIPFGWDDQYLYGGNGDASGPSLPSRSPPSPSPYRVASNPQLGATASRHPRSVKHVMSMPSLNEEAPSNGLIADSPFNSAALDAFNIDDFVNTEWSNMTLGDDGAETSPSQTCGQEAHLAPGELAILKELLDTNNQSIPATTERSTDASSAGSSSSLSVSPAQLMQSALPLVSSAPIDSAPSLIPDLSSASTVSNFDAGAHENQFVGWQPDMAATQESFDYSSNVFQNVIEREPRPFTADAPNGMPKWPSGSDSLAIPGGNMQRSISANAVPTVRGPGAPPPVHNGTPSQLSTTATPPWSDTAYYYVSPDNLQQGSFTSQRPPPRTEPMPAMTSRHISGTAMSAIQSQWPNGIFSPTAPSMYSPYPSVLQGSPLVSSSTGMARTFTEPLPGTYPQSRVTSAKHSQPQVVKATADPAQLAMSAYPSSFASHEQFQGYWQSPPMAQAPLPHQPLPAQQSMPIGLGYPQSGFYNSASAPSTSAGYGNGNGSVPGLMTNTPLHTIHPPANSFVPNPHTRPVTQPIPSQPHRVHPPPQPLASSRPMAKMPSGGAGRRSRNVTGSTSNSSPAAAAKPKAPRAAAAPRKSAMPAGGVDMWGGTQFMNYTPADGKKLLSGVAPSGSQSKRKREEEAAAAAAAGPHLSVPMGYTRSGSSIGSNGNGPDDRSKRSRSSTSR